ncbi:MAG: cytochrome b N-terminal domain-containing protein [Pirellulaceae bacterium]
MSRILNWVEHRTGLRALAHEALYENIPSGARFRYVTGSMLVFAFVTQVVTGLFLWMAYSPSSQTAWESVYYIQYQMAGGWLLRGVHHFMAQVMIVVMGLHLLQVIVDGAYRAPREVNYWLGIVLMQLVLGLGLTGYLLPWDQKGYWATNVATNLMTLVPLVGQELQKVALGGGEYGHHTLTRFFAMHAGVLPALVVVFLGAHVALFRRHGITAKVTPGRPDQYFWPKQVLYDGIGCLVMLIVVVGLVMYFNGAELGAPADPSKQYSAARPEWYFLFLFQLLKYFESEFVGAIVVPGVIMGILTLAPIIGYSKWGHRFNVAFVLLLLVGAGTLTGLAIHEDWDKKEFIAAKHEAEQEADRVKELIVRREMRPDGELSSPLMIQDTAVELLRSDPLTQGPLLFEKHCSSCHAYRDAAGKTAITTREPAEEESEEESGESKKQQQSVSAPNLYGFASREWIAGVLDADQIASPDYFGKTAHRDGRMVAWVKKHLGSDADFPKEDREAIIAALSAQAQLRSQAEDEEKDQEKIAKGVALIQGTCATYCHKFGDAGQWGLAPDLTGYGSYEWMLGLISDPTHARFYRSENDRMPSFAKHLDQPATNTVSVRELSLIVDWIRGDYYQPHDKRPVMPHDADEAQRAVELARVMPSDLQSSDGVIGEKLSTAQQQTLKAERLFRLNCAPCHSHVAPTGRGIAALKPSAPNLYGFASRDWLKGLMDVNRINSPEYFGNTSHADGEMADFLNSSFSPDSFEDDEEGLKEALALREKVIVALSAEAQLPSQTEADAKAKQDGVLEEGQEAISGAGFNGGDCTDCHNYRDSGLSGGYPDLDGYGSREWIVGMIADPDNEHYYEGANDRMPAFGAASASGKPMLSQEEMLLLARWLRGEDLGVEVEPAAADDQ